MELNLRQKLRASHVKRWHIVETLRPQSVAEHSFNVCMIAEEITKVLNISHDIVQQIIRYALYHDVPEVVLGDMPTPTKAVLGQDAMERVSEIEELVTPEVSHPLMLVYDVMKLADTLEAVLFLATYGVGKHAELVRNGLIDSVWKLVAKFPAESREKLITLVGDMVRWETLMDDGKGVSWHSKG